MNTEEEVAVLLTRIGQEVSVLGSQPSHPFLQSSIMRSSPGKEESKIQSRTFGANGRVAGVASVGGRGSPQHRPFIDSGPSFALAAPPLFRLSAATTGLAHPLFSSESMVGVMPTQVADPLIVALRERHFDQAMMNEQMLEPSTMGLLAGNTSGDSRRPNYQQVPSILQPPFPHWFPGAPHLHHPFVHDVATIPLQVTPFAPNSFAPAWNHSAALQPLPPIYPGVNRFAFFAPEQTPPKDPEDPSAEQPALLVDRKQLKRRRISDPFPVRLHRLLLDIELEAKQDIISFTPSGKAFTVHKEGSFVKDIVPRYFRQNHIASFKRQLNVYGFDTVVGGVDGGSFRHVNFQRDKPELLKLIRPKPSFDCYDDDGKRNQQRNGHRHR